MKNALSGWTNLRGGPSMTCLAQELPQSPRCRLTRPKSVANWMAGLLLATMPIPLGRPLGSKHKATLAIEALLEGEAEKLTRKAVELALEGDTTALRLCLERLAPPAKSRRVSIDLPKLEVPQDLIAALSKVIEAMGRWRSELLMRRQLCVACWRQTGRRLRWWRLSGAWPRLSREVSRSERQQH